MAGLLILGAGGHGKVVAETASLMDSWDYISFLDNQLVGQHIIGYPVIGEFGEAERYRQQYTHAFVAIGNNKAREQWIQHLSELGYAIPTIIHPQSIISQHAVIGRATVIMAGVVVNASVKIGDGCILNTSSSISHDCVIHNGVHVSPGARISGSVIVGACSWIGTGSSIVNNVSIGTNVMVAAGSTITCDVPNHVMVAGTPAVVKKHLGDEAS